MTKERIKLIVIDEHTLGCLRPNSNYADVLHASVLRGSPYSTLLSSLNPILLKRNDVWFHEIRLASAKDFDDYRVCFKGFDNELEYEFAK